jgi:hypothetical protein
LGFSKSRINHGHSNVDEDADDEVEVNDVDNDDVNDRSDDMNKEFRRYLEDENDERHTGRVRRFRTYTYGYECQSQFLRRHYWWLGYCPL